MLNTVLTQVDLHCPAAPDASFIPNPGGFDLLIITNRDGCLNSKLVKVFIYKSL